MFQGGEKLEKEEKHEKQEKGLLKLMNIPLTPLNSCFPENSMIHTNNNHKLFKSAISFEHIFYPR